jgi:small subunit ribosomal protein S21
VLPSHLFSGAQWSEERSGGFQGDALILRLPSAHVTQILIRDGDSFEVALKRFTRNVQQAGILSEWKRRQRYEPPSVKRKRKAEAQDRKRRRAEAKAKARGY